MKKIIISLAIALAGIVYSQTVDNPLVTTNADGLVTTISVDADNNYTTNTVAAPVPDPVIITNPDGSTITIVTNPDHTYTTNITAAPLPPQLVISSITNVVNIVEPIILTPYQMTGIIQMVQTSGISANVPISITNLDRVNLMHNGDGTFTVRISLR